ncbi:MAG: polyamine aminopropyltransferase [Alphaproteobacteria bacterium]|nr:MAG: polyamine aminopropyltransferase [Alphaproteobacteria bacterium]
MNAPGWFEETLHDGMKLALRAETVLYDSQTDYQRIVIFENAQFGRVLMLDNVVQTTEGDEFIYHEMLTHLPILAHGAVRRVLIVGGGDGGMLEETLKHASVERVTMVEIDPGVIELSKTYLPGICGQAFDDPRLDLVIADGKDFVTRCQDRFDLVIVDSTDPIGPGEVLFTQAFYEACKGCLAPGGLLVTQNGVPFLQGDELAGTLRCLRPLFRDAGCYLATVPTYVGGPMAFGWASDDTALRETPIEVLRARYRAAGIETRYYTPEVHRAAFALPGYVARLIEEA